jgi:hypothetical protein
MQLKIVMLGRNRLLERVAYYFTDLHVPRVFPAPWRADKVPGCYVVRDDNGQALASQ